MSFKNFRNQNIHERFTSDFFSSPQRQIAALKSNKFDNSTSDATIATS